MSQEEWNDFAAEYAAVQRASRLPLAQDAVAQLNAWYPLTGCTVADVAGGSGRYTRQLAAHAKHVTLSDWAPAMLAEARQDLSDLTNVAYQVADWHDLTGAQADWVFVSQLPGLTVADARRLRQLARTGLALFLQTGQTDSLTQAMSQALGLEPVAGPQLHANTDALAAMLHAKRRDFSYQLHDQAAVVDRLDQFARPFGAAQAQALALAATGQADAQQLVDTTVDYRFTLLVSTDKAPRP